MGSFLSPTTKVIIDLLDKKQTVWSKSAGLWNSPILDSFT